MITVEEAKLIPYHFGKRQLYQSFNSACWSEVVRNDPTIFVSTREEMIGSIPLYIRAILQDLVPEGMILVGVRYTKNGSAAGSVYDNQKQLYGMAQYLVRGTPESTLTTPLIEYFPFVLRPREENIDNLKFDVVGVWMIKSTVNWKEDFYLKIIRVQLNQLLPENSRIARWELYGNGAINALVSREKKRIGFIRYRPGGG